MHRTRLLRITTVPISLQILLRGQLQYMQSNGYDVLAVSAAGSEVSELKDAGISHRVIPFSRSITPLRDLYCLIKLIVLILKFRPDIVHTHTPKAGLIGMAASWICRVPLRIHTVAGLPYQESRGLKKFLLRCTENLTYAFARRVYANSKGLLSFMRSEFTQSTMKSDIIGNGSTNGVDLEYFSNSVWLISEQDTIRHTYKIGKADYVFCFVGRLVKDKGITELVSAFQNISEAYSDVWLILVGHYEEDLDPLTSVTLGNIRSNPRILHVGFQTDIRPWVLVSNALVLPSYREGFPNVLLQAGCLERPCIASAINGCNEIILNEQTGLLVPTKDIPSLEKAMRRLYAERAWGIMAGIEARQFIAKNFDQSYIWSEILKEYRKQLAFVQDTTKTVY